MSSYGKDQYLPRRRHITHVRINDDPYTINDVPQTEYRPLSKISAHGSTLSDYQPKILRTQSEDRDLLVYRKNSTDVNYLKAVISEGFAGNDSLSASELSPDGATRRKDSELTTPRRSRPFRHSFVRAVNRSGVRTTEELISEGAPSARQLRYRKWSSAEGLGPSDTVINVTLSGTGMVLSTNGETHDSTSFHTYSRDKTMSKGITQGRRVKRIANFFGSVRRGVTGGWQKSARKKQKRRNAVRRHVSLPSMKLFRRLKKSEVKEETDGEKSPLHGKSRKEQVAAKVGSYALSPALARFNEFLRSSHESVGDASALDENKGNKFANALDSISLRVQRLRPKRIRRWFSDRLLSTEHSDSDFETIESSEELIGNDLHASINGVSDESKLGHKEIAKQHSFKESFSKGLRQIATGLEKLRRQRLFRGTVKEDAKAWVSEDNLVASNYLSNVRYDVNNVTVIELKFDDDESKPIAAEVTVPRNSGIPIICINGNEADLTPISIMLTNGKDELENGGTDSMEEPDSSEVRAVEYGSLDHKLAPRGDDLILYKGNDTCYVNDSFEDTDVLTQSSTTTREPNTDTRINESVCDEGKEAIDKPDNGCENSNESTIHDDRQLDLGVNSPNVIELQNTGLRMDTWNTEESVEDYFTTPVPRIPVPPRLPDVKVGTWPREHCRSTAEPPVQRTGRRKDSKDFQTELTAKILAFQTRLRLTYPEESV